MAQNDHVQLRHSSFEKQKFQYIHQALHAGLLSHSYCMYPKRPNWYIKPITPFPLALLNLPTNESQVGNTPLQLLDKLGLTHWAPTVFQVLGLAGKCGRRSKALVEVVAGLFECLLIVAGAHG